VVVSWERSVPLALPALLLSLVCLDAGNLRNDFNEVNAASCRGKAGIRLGCVTSDVMRRLLFQLLFVVLCGDVAAAEEAMAPAVVTLDEAMSEASSAPMVQALKRATREKRSWNGRISTATGNPSLNYFAGLRPDLPPPRVEMELGVYQPFNLSGLSGARKRAAGAEAEELEALTGSVELVYRVEVAQAWFRLWEAEHDLARAKAEAELAGSFLSKVARAVELQAMTAADLSDAQAYHAEATLSAVNAEGDLFDAGMALARQLGRSTTTPLHARLDEPQIPAVMPLPAEELPKRADRLPGVATLLRSAEAEGSRLQEFGATRGVQLQVGLSVLRSFNVGTGGVVSAAVSLPVLDKGERERGALVAEYERLRGEYESGRAAAVTELTVAQHEVEHTQEVLEALESKVVPALKKASQERLRLLELGEGSILDSIITRRALIAGETRLSRARAAHGSAVWRWKLLIDATESPKGDAR
jgi:outer membrane protein TolC